MKRSKAQGSIGLIVIGLLFFGWIQREIGGIGIFILVALAISGWIIIKKQKDKEAQKNFDGLALYTLYENSSFPEKKKINTEVSKVNPYKAELIRDLQIIQESIYIALTSKKKDVAESRLQTVIECYERIKVGTASLVSPTVFNEITRVVKDAESEFQTFLYTNIANGHLEKADTLKTAKSKIKYLGLAEEIIQEGMQNNLSQKEILRSKLEDISLRKKELA